MERAGASPSAFDKDHFRYGNDSLNYFRLYEELILPYDSISRAAKNLCAKTSGTGPITFDDVAQETFVSQIFFRLFPEKLTTLQELLVKEMRK
ncbi:hypothetical protein AGMMS49579_26580 [Spirochaetia bacterium]|nr:hypothetical protein AGMMS49579_26580 [Spirochaetia bacterium]